MVHHSTRTAPVPLGRWCHAPVKKGSKTTSHRKSRRHGLGKFHGDMAIYGNGNNGQVEPRICRKKTMTSVPHLCHLCAAISLEPMCTSFCPFRSFQHFVASTQTASVCIYCNDCIHVIMNSVPVVPMLHPKQRALVNMVNVSLTFATSDFILSWLHEAGNGSTRITTILRALPE